MKAATYGPHSGGLGLRFSNASSARRIIDMFKTAHHRMEVLRKLSLFGAGKLAVIVSHYTNTSKHTGILLRKRIDDLAIHVKLRLSTALAQR